MNITNKNMTTESNDEKNSYDLENESTQEKSLLQEMNLLEHLEELRKRIIYVVVFLIISCIFIGIFISELMQKIFLAPALEANLTLQNLLPFGQPFLYFKVILASATILTTPFFLYQFWKFIAPALYENEKKWVGLATFFTTFCFAIGIIFSYFILIPSMLKFAANFGSDLIANNIDVNEYFGFISIILIATGSVFELPMISFILTKIGLINPKTLGKYRRHAIIFILILAAVLTPTPDPISQLIFAAPIFILYEISIFISFLAIKRKKI